MLFFKTNYILTHKLATGWLVLLWLIPAFSRANVTPHLEGQMGGIIKNAVVAGNYVYALESSRLAVIDISDPAHPARVGTLPLDRVGSHGYSLMDIEISGQTVYLANNSAGVRIIDVSNPTNPRQHSIYNTPGNVLNLDVQGNLVYAVNDGGANDLLILDVTDPTSATLRGAIDVLGGARDVKVSGGLAYVVSEYFGFVIYDVSNPETPVFRGSLPLMVGSAELILHGNLAYVYQGDGYVHVVDISNPALPVLAHSFQLSDNIYGGGFCFRVDGDLLYMADGEEGLKIYEASDPTTLTLRGQIALPGSADALQVFDQKAIVCNFSEGLQVVDVANPDNPQSLGAYDMPDWNVDSAISGGMAYVIGYDESSLDLIDVSQPSAPRLKSQLPLSTFFYPDLGGGSVAVDGGLACVTGGNPGGLRVIDVSNPLNPVLRATCGTYDGELVVSGNRAYVCTLAGLDVIDLSNPANPTLKTSYSTNYPYSHGGGIAVAVAGTRAYLAAGNAGLRVLDLSNPNAVTLLGTYDAGTSYDGMVTKVAQAGNLVCIGCEGSMRIINVSNPANPTLVYSYNLPRRITGAPGMVECLGISGDWLYLQASTLGFQLLDVSDPAHPTIVSEYLTWNNMPLYPYAFHIVGDYLYCDFDGDGMAIFRMMEWVPSAARKEWSLYR